MIYNSLKRLAFLFSFLFLIVISLSTYGQTKDGTVVLVSGNNKQATAFINQHRKTNPSTVVIDILNLPKSDILSFLGSATEIVLIGKKSFEFYLVNQVDTPSLVVYVKRSTFYHLIEAYKHINLINGKNTFFNKISALYSDPDINSQLSLISKHYPNKAATVMLSPLNDFLKSALKNAANSEGVSLNILSVSSDVDINKALNTLPNNHALLAIPDPVIYNRHSLKNIIISTYRSNRPVFGYSENMVKAGAVASYYTDTEDLVREANELLIKMSSINIPYREHASYHKLSINAAVARSLNINSLKSSS